MDRTWMINRSAFDRRQPKYIKGVDSFLEFAFNGKDRGDVMRCPCKNCLFCYFKDRDSMWIHLMYYGIKNDYNPWDFHGEDPAQSSSDNEDTSCEEESLEQVTHDSEEGTQASQDTVVGSNEVPSQPSLEPEYMTLTKRHKDNSWDKAVEQRLEDFKALDKQVELNGVENLTVQEGYVKALGTSPDYINGLGFGPKPPERITKGRSGGEGIEIAHQMVELPEQMERHSREREALEKVSREREAESKGEIQRLKEDKVEMLREIEKLRKEAEEREKRE